MDADAQLILSSVFILRLYPTGWRYPHSAINTIHPWEDSIHNLGAFFSEPSVMLGLLKGLL